MNYHAVESRLAPVRSQLERTLAGISDADWTRSPAGGGWSVAEVIAHLIQVETVIHDAARKYLGQEIRPLKRGLLPRLIWPPIWLIAWRELGFKRKSPIPMDPALVTNKADMLAKFAARRSTTLAFLKETMAEGRDLGQYHWKHPFFGPLTFPEWLRVIGYHETRHTKQIREIVSSFQS